MLRADDDNPAGICDHRRPMCGIAGFAARDCDPVDRELPLRMARTLAHRGPDGEGVHVAPGVGLGVRRLSIVDVEHGDQPIANEDGSVVLVCNGEIYNAPELRARLEAAGHRFRSASDVEVIVHLYEEHGTGCVDHLRGMFGFALWDARRKRLVLGRDRLGIKPLCYHQSADGLWFASEAKAIVASDRFERALDPAALRDLLTFGFVCSPRTLFAGIVRLPAGCVLIYERGQARVERYWEVSFPGRGENPARREEEWADELRSKLTETVRIHLRSDVPVGMYLSGGLDSSSVASLMCSLATSPVRSYSLGFDVDRFDELRRHRLLYDFPGFRL
jgi:asparagine synthase (glutamine-hydrolysing)